VVIIFTSNKMRFILALLVLLSVFAVAQAQYGQDVGLVQQTSKRLQRVAVETASGVAAGTVPASTTTTTTVAAGTVPASTSATGAAPGTAATSTAPAPGAPNQPIDSGLSGAVTVGASFALYPFHFNPVTRETDAWTEGTEAAQYGSVQQAVADASAATPAATTQTAAAGTAPRAAFLEGQVAASCPGTCQDSNKYFCKTGYRSGLCSGAASVKCCPSVAAAAGGSTPSAPSAPSAPAVTPTAPASLNKCPTPGKCGAASRVQDPVTIARARSFAWTDLTVEQQSNVLRITKEAKLQGITNVNAFAYIIATAHWESHLTPINEIGGPRKRYAPYYGRGFVQLTWKTNYEKFSKLLKSERGWNNDIVNRPEQALNPDFSAFVIVYGMKYGTFTGKKLSDYFTASSSDWIKARRMINGNDKATTIGSLGRQHVALARALLAMN